MQISVPLGTILFFYAEAQNEALPTDYAYCEGQNLGPAQQDIVPGGNFVVPDLRNRFLIGADRMKPVLAAPVETATDYTGAPGPMRLGGGHSIALNSTHTPNHTHSASSDAAGGSHGHSWSLTGVGGHTHGPTAMSFILSNNGGTAQYGTGALGEQEKFGTGTAGSTNSEGAHSHSVSSGVAGAHSHTISISTTGSNQAWDSRPRFYALVYVMKVKN
jgi:hypothetical protein